MLRGHRGRNQELCRGEVRGSRHAIPAPPPRHTAPLTWHGILPYPRFCIPQFQLPTVHRGLKISNGKFHKQFIGFNVWTVPSSVMKSLAVLSIPEPGMWIIPLSRQPRCPPASHIVGTLAMRSNTRSINYAGFVLSVASGITGGLGA